MPAPAIITDDVDDKDVIFGCYRMPFEIVSQRA